MSAFIEWITDSENIQGLFTVVTALVSVASGVTALTKTPKDDKVVSKIKSFLDRLSFLSHKDAKGTLKLPGRRSQD